MIRFNLQKKLTASEGDLNLTIATTITSGELISLYGPSGAGKTSILRMLAGLMPPDSGRIEVNGQIWFDSSKNVLRPPQDRRIGYVFQNYALFPNMTVRENLLFALDKKQDYKIIEELVDLIEVGDLQHRKPATLSGGQKQRVALARALVRQPDLLLLDEPLSALDFNMRSKLQDYILNVHQRYGLTIILVTHELGEIFKMSNRTLSINQGQIIKDGSPWDVFSKQQLNGKFRFTGKVLHIQKADVVYIVSVLIGNNLVKVIADQIDVSEIRVGDKIIVASKAFNPIIQKI